MCRNAGLETVDYRDIPGGPQGLGLSAFAAMAQISIPVWGNSDPTSRAEKPKRKTTV